MAEQRYAVVSCHVERPLDDRAWSAFSRLQRQRPGGFSIAALLRPPDAAAGEDEERWLARALEAAERGPLGHHTHFGGPETARPPEGAEPPAERVRREAGWLRERGLRPRFFCGGGWYMDAGVAAVLAELEYADCTATEFRPSYLPDGAPRLSLAKPMWLRVDGRRLLEIPTTHSIGMAARSAIDPQVTVSPVLHVYFHDTDLLNARRRVALRTALGLLARRREVTDLDALADRVAPEANSIDFAEAQAR